MQYINKLACYVSTQHKIGNPSKVKFIEEAKPVLKKESFSLSVCVCDG